MKEREASPYVVPTSQKNKHLKHILMILSRREQNLELTRTKENALKIAFLRQSNKWLILSNTPHYSKLIKTKLRKIILKSFKQTVQSKSIKLKF